MQEDRWTCLAIRSILSVLCACAICLAGTFVRQRKQFICLLALAVSKAIVCLLCPLSRVASTTAYSPVRILFEVVALGQPMSDDDDLFFFDDADDEVSRDALQELSLIHISEPTRPY